jgi:hypothetical protein
VPEQERNAIVEYIKTFSARWKTSSPGVVIAIPDDPFRDDPMAIRKAVKRGELLYHTTTTCWQCHPSYVSPQKFEELYGEAKKKFPGVRENFDKPVVKPDGWGNPLMPTDFKRDRIKTGIELNSLFRVIATGIGGTAMPSWKDSIPDEDIWALTYYIRSLADERNDRLRHNILSPPAETKGASR